MSSPINSPINRKSKHQRFLSISFNLCSYAETTRPHTAKVKKSLCIDLIAAMSRLELNVQITETYSSTSLKNVYSRLDHGILHNPSYLKAI